MGKFEKLVVLTVLFAAALVLAIALNRGREDEALASGPLGAVPTVLEESAPASRTGTGDTSGQRADPSPTGADDQDAGATAERRGTSLLLSAGDEFPSGLAPKASVEGAPGGAASAVGALSLEPSSDPTRRILTDTNGLRPSFLDEYMVYTAVEGDSWSGLAQRFYQDGRYTRNLQRANDDLSELRPGTEVLIPVFDFLQDDAGLQAGGDVVASATDAARAPATEPVTKPPLPPASGAKLLEYEVRSGDTLSDISFAVFGTATRWKEILDVNRDKLQKPEGLQVGMKLKIPAGGKLPAAPSIQPGQPGQASSKAKTTQAPTQAVQPKGQGPQPKKKRVL